MSFYQILFTKHAVSLKVVVVVVVVVVVLRTRFRTGSRSSRNTLCLILLCNLVAQDPIVQIHNRQYIYIIQSCCCLFTWNQILIWFSCSPSSRDSSRRRSSVRYRLACGPGQLINQSINQTTSKQAISHSIK